MLLLSSMKGWSHPWGISCLVSRRSVAVDIVVAGRRRIRVGTWRRWSRARGRRRIS